MFARVIRVVILLGFFSTPFAALGAEQRDYAREWRESLALQHTNLRPWYGRWKIVLLEPDDWVFAGFREANLGTILVISESRIDFAGATCVILNKAISTTGDPAYPKSISYGCANKIRIPDISIGEFRNCIFMWAEGVTYYLRRAGDRGKAACPKTLEARRRPPPKSVKLEKSSCHVTAGARKAQQYVDACRKVMTSKNAPCHEAYSCEMMAYYVKDRCEWLWPSNTKDGEEAPDVCKKFSGK